MKSSSLELELSLSKRAHHHGVNNKVISRRAA